MKLLRQRPFILLLSLLSLACCNAVLLLGPLALAQTAPPLEAATARIAIVQSVQGQLFVCHENEKQYAEIATGEALVRGDIIKTGPRSHAVVLLTNKAELELGADMAMQVPCPVDVSVFSVASRAEGKQGRAGY